MAEAAKNNDQAEVPQQEDEQAKANLLNSEDDEVAQHSDEQPMERQSIVSDLEKEH